VSTAGGSPGTPSSCLVVDASVVIKWHVAEIHADASLRLLGDDAPALHVPDLMLPEVGNILWKKVRRGDLTEEQARGIAHLVAVAPLEVHPSAPLLEAAFEIATRTGRTVYDGLYAALAVRLDSRLVTADERLYNALKDGPLGAHILWVEDDLGMHAGTEAEDFVIARDHGSTRGADEIELIYSFFTGDRLADSDLTQLVGLAADLRELYLQSPGITDAGLAHLRGLAKLTTLYLGGSSVTDAGLVHLRGLVGLRTLNLARTAITDAGLAHLRELNGLRKLVLWGTGVTDTGLSYLRTLAGLRELDLERTQVSEAGVEDLRRALPEVEIVG
jgi:predicted nucleic acid-binding protein